jgi:hypothetical protein
VDGVEEDLAVAWAGEEASDIAGSGVEGITIPLSPMAGQALLPRKMKRLSFRSTKGAKRGDGSCSPELESLEKVVRKLK